MLLVPLASLLLALLLPSLAQPNNLDAELQAMAETERAFARTAGQKGWQHAFYDFFAEDGVGFNPAPVRFRENYRKQPPPPDPLTSVLDWEPLYGDIAESADLGWLTGPFVVTDKTETKRPPSWGFYSSVWKKQPDSTWRVAADMGVAIPPREGTLPRNQFLRAPQEESGKPHTSAGADLSRAESAFAADAESGLAAAYDKWLSPRARLHRNGHNPLTTLGAIREYLATQPQSGAWRTLHAQAAKSGDLGYSYGSYELKNDGATTQTGYYLRVWKRNPEGQWRLVFEVTSPLRPIATQQ